MGNQASLAGFSSDQVVDVTLNILEALAPLYVRAYGRRLILGLSADADGAAPKLALERPPVEREALAKAWMVKLGAVKASWKRRFFVAMGEVGLAASFPSVQLADGA
jgi:hypothetical protein